MATFDLLVAQRDTILNLAHKHGAHSVRVFGSVARGSDSETSDIDFLVSLEKGRSLLDLIGFKHDLEDCLHRQADVITEEGLHPLIRQQVLGEARPL